MHIEQLKLKIFVSGGYTLTQADVDLVIDRTRRSIGNSRPAMLRLTFHDCVGKTQVIYKASSLFSDDERWMRWMH